MYTIRERRELFTLLCKERIQIRLVVLYIICTTSEWPTSKTFFKFCVPHVPYTIMCCFWIGATPAFTKNKNKKQNKTKHNKKTKTTTKQKTKQNKTKKVHWFSGIDFWTFWRFWSNCFFFFFFFFFCLHMVGW